MVDGLEATRDLPTLVLGRGEPLADERSESFDLLLDLDTAVLYGVPVGVRHRPVEAHVLGPAPESPVRTDDLTVPVGLEEVSEEGDLLLDPLNGLLHLLDGRRQGESHERELHRHRLLRHHGQRLQGAVTGDRPVGRSPEPSVEPVTDRAQGAGLVQGLAGRIELEHRLGRPADGPDERRQRGESAKTGSGRLLDRPLRWQSRSGHAADLGPTQGRPRSAEDTG